MYIFSNPHCWSSKPLTDISESLCVRSVFEILCCSLIRYFWWSRMFNHRRKSRKLCGSTLGELCGKIVWLTFTHSHINVGRTQGTSQEHMYMSSLYRSLLTLINIVEISGSLRNYVGFEVMPRAMAVWLDYSQTQYTRLLDKMLPEFRVAVPTQEVI